MLSLFKTKGASSEPPTLKTRVEQFWKWYSEVAPRFYQTIEAKNCPSLAPEVSAKVDELLPGFAWVFGPGANKQGHSFTLSGEGNIHRQLLARYWLGLAPKLPGWTFYAARQPGNVEGQRIQIGDREFNPIEFWITPEIDTENETINLTVWHPLFDILPEGDRWTILFLFLDEALGEYGTAQFIGSIEFSKEHFKDAVPITELLGFAKQTAQEHGWKNRTPGQSGFVYKRDEQNDHLRGDIVIGSTTNMRLINDYDYANEGIDDPLSGTGSDYVFIAFDASILPEGKQAMARGEIEDALRKALETAKGGLVLGGALGTRFAYIDLLLFDGQNSLEILRQVLKQKNLPVGTEIHFFAKEKRGQRLVL